MTITSPARCVFTRLGAWSRYLMIVLACGNGGLRRLDAAPPEKSNDSIVLSGEDSSKPFKTPFTRLLELPGRAVRGVGDAVSSTGKWAGEKLDAARAIRDEIYRDGWEKFVDKRMEKLGRSVMDGVEGAVGGAGDLAHGRAERVSRDPDHADTAWKSRRDAVEKAKEGLDSLSKKVNPVLAPTRKATEIASDPNFDRTKALANWIDASARTMAHETLKGATKATQKDVQERVKQRLREQMQKLPYDQQVWARSVLDKTVAKAVGSTFNAAGGAVERAVDPPTAKSTTNKPVSPKPAPPKPAPSRVLLSGAAGWDAGNGNQQCTIAGTIDVTAGQFTGKCVNGVFRKVPGQTFAGNFQGKYAGNATHGQLRGNGGITIRWRDSKTGKPGAHTYAYDLQATHSGGVVTGALTRRGEVLYRFSLPVR